MSSSLIANQKNNSTRKIQSSTIGNSDSQEYNPQSQSIQLQQQVQSNNNNNINNQQFKSSLKNINKYSINQPQLNTFQEDQSQSLYQSNYNNTIDQQNNSNINMNNNQNPQQIRSSIKVHRQLISSSTTKPSTPRSYDIKGTSITNTNNGINNMNNMINYNSNNNNNNYNNQQQSQQQKYISMTPQSNKISSTIINGQSISQSASNNNNNNNNYNYYNNNSNAQSNGNLYQINQSIPIRPYSGNVNQNQTNNGLSSTGRVNTYEGDSSQDQFNIFNPQQSQQFIQQQQQQQYQGKQVVQLQQQQQLNNNYQQVQNINGYSPIRQIDTNYNHSNRSQQQNYYNNNNNNTPHELSDNLSQYQQQNIQQQQQQNFPQFNQEQKVQQKIQFTGSLQNQETSSSSQSLNNKQHQSKLFGNSLQLNLINNTMTNGIVQQNITKIIKLLDYLTQKNLIDDAIDVFYDYLNNHISINNNNNNVNQLPSNNSISENFHERNKVFHYASKFYSILSNEESSLSAITSQTTASQLFQHGNSIHGGGFLFSNIQNYSISQSASQYSNHPSNMSAIYQGNLHFTANNNNNINNTFANNISTQNENASNMSYHQLSNSVNNFNSNNNNNANANKRKNELRIRMREIFQICMEKIIEENSQYSQNNQYSKQQQILLQQKIVYLNNLAVHHFKTHNYPLAFDQFSTILSYSQLPLITPNLSVKLQQQPQQQQQSTLGNSIIQPTILNNVGVSCILLEEWNNGEIILSNSIAQSEARVFPNIKNIEKRYLIEDKEFLQELPALVFGYVYAELIKRIKLALKISLTSFNVATDTFFIKNAIHITKKYFGSDHSLTRKIIAIQKILDAHLFIQNNNINNNGQPQQQQQLQQSDEPDLFDSQPLTQSLPSINPQTINNNNIGQNISSQNNIQQCIYLILKECQFELNQKEITLYRNYMKFKKVNFDSELFSWRKSNESQQQYHHSFNQSSTRISTEPSSLLPLSKKHFNSMQTSPPNHGSIVDQPAQSDRIYNTNTLKKDTERANSNGEFNVSQNGTNAYFLQGHHNNGNNQGQMRQGSQSYRQQHQSIRHKNINSVVNQQQNNNSGIINNSNHSHLQHRQYYPINSQQQQQNEKSIFKQNNNNDNQSSLKNNSKNVVLIDQNNNNQRRYQNQYGTNESLQDPNDQSEVVSNPTNEQLIDQDEQEYETQQQQDDYYDYNHNNNQNNKIIHNKNNNSNKLSQSNSNNKNQQTKGNNNVQEDQNQNSKRISTKRVQSEYFLKTNNNNPNNMNQQDQNSQQQQQSSQQLHQSGIPLEKNHEMDENIKKMITEVMNQNEEIKREKGKSMQEISELKKMLNNLIEQQKNSSTQLQQQQQHLIDNHIAQLNKLEKTKAEQQQQQFLQSQSQMQRPQTGLSVTSQMVQSNNNNNNNIVNQQQQQPRSPFYSTQSPITPQLPILQLFNIFSDCPYESFSLSKQIFVTSTTTTTNPTTTTTTPYTITCKLYKSGSLEIKAENANNNALISSENIIKDQLKELLINLKYQSVIPVSFSLNMCQNIFFLNKYFILPYTSLDPVKKEIKFFSNAPGLLSKIYERTFLGEKVVQFFHHIEGNQFRIVLNQKKERGYSLKIDLDLDSGSQKKWVDWINENEFSKDEMQGIIDLTQESEHQRNEQIKEMQQRCLNIDAIKKYIPKTNSVSKLRSYKILNETALMKEIDDILDQMQDLFHAQLIKDLSTLFQSPFYIRVKIWSITQKRQVHLCIDNPNFIPQIQTSTPKAQTNAPNTNAASNQSKQNTNVEYGEIKVILKNIYHTFGPGGEKLKAQGVSSYSYNQVQSMYNLNYENLHLSEKVCILSHIPDYFTLSVHEKNDETLQNAKTTKQSENPIVRSMHASGAYCRMLHKFAIPIQSSISQHYLSPITFEAIGANSKLLGIRVSIYNQNNLKENGIFFTAEDQHWLFENRVLAKNLHHLYLEGLPLSQFLLSHIFEEITVPLILKNITIFEDPNKNNELSIRLNKGLITSNSTSIYRIENILNLHEIVKNSQYIISKNPQ